MKKPTLREEPAAWLDGTKSGRRVKGKAALPPSAKLLGSSTITAKGQTTIPKAIRDRLGLRPGSRLDFELRPDGTIRLRGASVPLLSLFGIFGKPKRRLTLEEIDESIARMWSRRR
jgi:AbrB family looped-hinge helix DNA binding protein